jgi:hypothetical protein
VRSNHESTGTTTTLWSGDGDDLVTVTEMGPIALVIHGEAGLDVIEADVLLTDVGMITGVLQPNSLCWDDLNAAVVADLLNADLVLLTGAYNADGSRHLVENPWGCQEWETELILVSLLSDGNDVMDGGAGDDALFGGRGTMCWTAATMQSMSLPFPRSRMFSMGCA